MIILTGWSAIRWAQRNEMRLSKRSDPVEGERENLTITEAEDVAKEDPSLIFLELDGWPYEYNYEMWIDHRPRGCRWPEEKD